MGIEIAISLSVRNPNKAVAAVLAKSVSPMSRTSPDWNGKGRGGFVAVRPSSVFWKGDINES